jgi:hypothetical protein
MAKGGIVWASAAASLDQDALVNAYLGHSDDIPA